MKSKIIFTILFLITALAYGYYYYFIQTLSLSEITGQSNDPLSSIVINLMDFDTGLTRNDVQRLSVKAPLWNRRIEEIKQIRDPRIQKEEDTKLVAEMMQDPSMKKVTQKLLGFGLKGLEYFLGALR